MIDGFWMASKLARAPYRWAAGPELTNLSATPAGSAVTVTGRADDARFNNSEGAEPAQAIAGICSGTSVLRVSPGRSFTMRRDTATKEVHCVTSA